MALHPVPIRRTVEPAVADLSRLPGERTATSYTLPEGLSLAEWLTIGQALQAAEMAVQWWLGDWWRYGQRRYGDMARPAAKEAIKDATGYAYETVRKAGQVAERFESGRRRPDVPFSYHREVVDLPPAEADRLLDQARAGDGKTGLRSRDVRERARIARRTVARERALLLPAPAPELIPPSARLEVADSRALPFDDESVHLIVTSPPYGVGIAAYQNGGDVPADAWPAYMREWLTEALRVAVPSGRLALNVPLDTTSGGFRPTYAQAVQAAQDASWRYHQTITWWDQHLGKSVARGSIDSSASPSIIAPVEMIVLFSKGDWRREPTAAADLTREEWLTWTNGVWATRGETQPWEGFPAAFPEEIPRRLIKLLTSPGEVVLDQHLGSGTTALAAVRLGRQALGSDRSPAYVTSSLRRLAALGGAR